MEEQESKSMEMKREIVNILIDEKLFLQDLLRILERPYPTPHNEQQTKEEYKNVDRIEKESECSREEPYEDENNGNVQDEDMKTDDKTREAGWEESDAHKSNIQLMKGRKEVLQEQIKGEIKLCKQTEQELENQVKLHKTLREKLRNEKMQQEKRERKLLNRIKEREYLQKKLKCEEKACEYFKAKIRKETNHRQRLQEDMNKTISRTKTAQQKLIDEIKLTEYLQTMLNRRAKPLEEEAIPERQETKDSQRNTKTEERILQRT